jgi:hypothetical protein
VDRADDLAAVHALKVVLVMPRFACSELSLDDDEWDALVRHLDSMRVPHLDSDAGTAGVMMRGTAAETSRGSQATPKRPSIPTATKARSWTEPSSTSTARVGALPSSPGA